MKKIFWILISLFVSQNAFAEADLSASLAATKKIYYLLAAPKGSGRSFAGHTYLRLGMQDQPSADDLVIEFVADTPAENLSYLKAFGITDAYDRKVVVEKYRQVQYSMNFLSDRTLTSYELSLSPAQHQALIKKITSVVLAGQMGDYSFLSNNCAAAVSEIFSIVGIDLGWPVRILPTQIPANLEKRNLVRSTSKDLSLTARREALFVQYPLVKNFISPETAKKVTSEDAYKRIASLLLIKKESTNLPSQDRFRVKTYLLSAAFLENKFIREDLIRYFNDTTSFDLDQVLSFQADLRVQIQRAFGSNGKVAQIELIHSKMRSSADGFILVHSLRLSGRGPNSGIQKNVTLKQQLPLTLFRTGNNFEILFKDHLMGHLVSKDVNSDGILLTQGWLQTELVESEGRVTLTTFVVREPSRSQIPNQLTFENESSLKNNNPNDPMCFGLVDLQKRLIENIIWRPEQAPLSSKSNFALLKELMKGKILVIPGFSNARDWTSSLPKAEFIKLISQYHRSQYTELGSAVRTYFDQIVINAKNLQFIQQKAQRGIYTPIFFRTSSGIGHAILVTGLHRDSSGKTVLEAYDPNILSQKGSLSGFTKDVFEIDPESGIIKSFMYGASQAYFLNETLSSEYQTREVMMNPSSVKLLMTYSEKIGKFEFDLTDLSTAY